MKKSIVFLLLPLFSGYIGNVTAQIREEVQINVSATVLGALTIESKGDADFGNISSTTSGEVFLDPQGSESAYVGATATAGKLLIKGEGSQSVRLGWTSPITLTGTSDDLSLTFAVSGSGSDIQVASDDLIADAGFVTVSLNSGAYYVWIGGSIGTLDSKAAGLYTGTAYFTVEYN
jgi:hypothetical protein